MFCDYRFLMTLEHFEKAQQKVDKYQWTSDIGTDENENIGKRTVNKPKRYRPESSESSDDDITTISKKIPPRPPTIFKDISNKCTAKAVHVKDKVISTASTSVSFNQEEAASVEEEINSGNIFIHSFYIICIYTYLYNYIL